MENYREVELLTQKTLGDSGTETIDINVDEPITELSVRFYVRNDSAAADEVPPESCVSKIEIVDGGTVYSSLNGREATAMAWYDKGRWPAHWYSSQANEGSRVEWPFQFGRFLGDPEYAFSPTRLLNPQLKFTWAKNALHLADSCKLDVNAKVMQGVSAPGQALMTKVIRSWTGSAAATVEVDLPTDYPYRRLYFGEYLAETTFANMITNAKLECDVGKLVVFDMDDEQLMNLMERLWGLAEYADLPCLSNNESYMSHLGFVRTFLATMWTADRVISACPTNIPYVAVYTRDLAGGAVNDQKVSVRVQGLCPELTYCYPFGRQDDPATWFRSSKYGSVKLKITEAGGATAASVFVQQPRPLP